MSASSVTMSLRFAPRLTAFSAARLIPHFVEVMQQPLLQNVRWVRPFGDVVFIVGAVSMALQVVLGLLDRPAARPHAGQVDGDEVADGRRTTGADRTHGLQLVRRGGTEPVSIGLSLSGSVR